MRQLDLLLPRVQRKAAEMMDRFLLLLQEEGDWVKGSTISTRLHTSDRVLRSCASQSNGRVLSGQKGYRLTQDATLDEITHAENWLRSQARQMLLRSLEIRRFRHQGGKKVA